MRLYAYADIVAEDKDTYGIKKQLEDFIKDNPSDDLEQWISQRKIANNLSDRAKDLLENAVHLYNNIDPTTFGANDASTYAHAYFRVLEAEYNDKVISIINKNLDFEKLYEEIDDIADEDERENWKKEARSLEKTKRGEKDFLTLGTIQVLLGKLRCDKMEPHANRIIQALWNGLTDEGKRAFVNGNMENVINHRMVDLYRNPGAHIGLMPLSSAMQGRAYVMNNLPMIIEWFK